MNYSIIRMNNAYVVQAWQERVLATASRRMAVRLVLEASRLLDAVPICAPPPLGDCAGHQSAVIGRKFLDDSGPIS
jgi:hypothetical protein